MSTNRRLDYLAECHRSETSLRIPARHRPRSMRDYVRAKVAERKPNGNSAWALPQRMRTETDAEIVEQTIAMLRTRPKLLYSLRTREIRDQQSYRTTYILEWHSRCPIDADGVVIRTASAERYHAAITALTAPRREAGAV